MDVKEYTRLSNFMHVSLEALLLKVSKVWAFTWKGTPHDIAMQLMNQIREFMPDNEGGD